MILFQAFPASKSQADTAQARSQIPSPSRSSTVLSLLFSIIAFHFLFSCSGGLGYGVILWSNPDDTNMEGVHNGQIILITGESKVNNSYTFEFNNNERVIETSRVAFFRHESNAEEYLAQFIQYRDWYAVNMNPSGLSMRENPSLNAEQVYRLRPRQRVKVLAQASELMTLGNIEGRWYEILTEDGVRGFAFDYYLHIEEQADDNKGTAVQVIKLAAYEQARDELEISLDNLQGIWYQKKYTQQLRSGQGIDLRLLMLPYGQLHLNEGSNTLDLYLDSGNSISQRISFDPEQVVSDSAAELHFPSSGTRTVFNKYDEISFYFHDKKNDEVIIELLKLSKEELRRYQKQALAQRKIALGLLLQNGSQYSAAKLYGSIRFQPNGQFNWSNTDALVEQDVLKSPQTKGTVFFPYKLGLNLQDKYDQLLTFEFADRQEASFLLKFGADRQVLLRYVPQFMFDKTGTLNRDEISKTVDVQMSVEGRPLVPSDLF